MTTIERCQRFANKAIALIEAKGECSETAQWLSVHAGMITDNASDRALARCCYASAVLDVKKAADTGLGQAEPHSMPWIQVRETLRQIQGHPGLKSIFTGPY